MKPIIELCDVSKVFQAQAVVKHVNLSLQADCIHGLVGHNGSGKTVLMKLICGLYKASDGTVIVNGQRVGRDVEFPESMGILIESPGLLPFYSGRKNLEVLWGLRGVIARETIEKTMRLVGLQPDNKKHVSKYSLGMRQRLGIAQAIMEDPQILLLDEPMNGLDKAGAADMRSLLRRLRAAGKTILLASHNPLDIETLCDHVYEMDAGVLAQLR